MEQSIKMVYMKQTLAHQQKQAKSFHRQQALVLMCRVYVGNISFELKEDSIKQAFSPFGFIKSIDMSWDPITRKHKGYAFVEYEIPEAAQLALEHMNGVVFGGRNIKVGRPSNMPQAQSVIDEIWEEAKQYYNFVYVASIHLNLTEDDIKCVFEAFGPIRTCTLAKSRTSNRHRGYGFIEYEGHQAAIEAISSMNLFDLGGRSLRVGRAITPPYALYVPSSSRHMPAAASVRASAFAATTATATVQAMDAGATNEVLSLSKLSSQVGAQTAVFPGLQQLPTTLGITPDIPAATIPPPGIAMPQQIRAPIPIISGAKRLSPVIQQAIPPPALINPTQLAAPVIPTVIADVQKWADQQKELQKKVLEETEPQTLQQQENMSIKEQSARLLVMQKLIRKTESKVVILKNMLGVEDVDDNLQEEIQDECCKFGVVKRIIIYKEKQSDCVDEDSDTIVKIFVEFTQMSEAEQARDSINGRFFGGRLVKAELYDQALFDHSDFSG
eukprot:XP_016657480.1 PREDICTED: poly(U)-binding-splicing factor half pint-like [Acyrthosiphon pisum]